MIKNNNLENEVVPIELFDTSLRDGSQKSDDYPTDKQAALIAAALAKLGIGHLEIGVPVAENQSKKRLELIIQAVKLTGKNPILYGFSRCVKNDIDAVINKMESAENKGINIVVSGSELFQILRDSKLKNKNWEELNENEIIQMENRILENIKEQISYASTLFENVRVCFEDGSMGKEDFLIKAIKVAGESGAGVVSIPDTLGGLLPWELKNLLQNLIKETSELQKKGLKFAIHSHDDKGLALSNSLESIRLGVTSIEGTLLGSGERVGNLNLKDFIGNIVTNCGRILEGKTIECEGVITNELYKTYKIIHALLGKKWNPYARFIGEQSTKTQVGIHQDLENKGSIEIKKFLNKHGRETPYSLINTNIFGVPDTNTTMYTNLSGFSNLNECLKQYGICIDKNDPIVKKIEKGLKDDLENTKTVYSSRVYLEYLIQKKKVSRIESKNIKIHNDYLIIELEIGGKILILKSKLTKKDGQLGAAVKAINNYLDTKNRITLTDFDLIMHEGVEIIAKRYPNTIGNIYEKLNINNGGEQMGISNIEFTNKQVPYKSTAHDLHGNTANIKALLYGCFDQIYKKFSNDNIKKYNIN